MQRAEWVQRAGAVAAYREAYGWDHPARPVAEQEPEATDPEHRAAWQEALAALAIWDGIDVRDMDRAGLEARMAMAERTAGLMGPDVTDDLRIAREAEAEAREQSWRAGELAAAADTPQQARQHLANKAIWEAQLANAGDARTVRERLAERQEQLAVRTEHQGRVAAAAQLEFDRQYPGEHVRATGQPADPDRIAEAERREAAARRQAEPDAERGAPPAERQPGWLPDWYRLDPEPAAAASPEARAEPAAVPPPEQEPVQTARAADQAAAARLGLTSATTDSPERDTAEIDAAADRLDAELDAQDAMQIPNPDPDLAPSQAWAAATQRDRDAVLQPPERLVEPSPQLQAQHREPEMEAAG